MNTEQDRELRMQCLALASANVEFNDTSVIARARAFYEFATAAGDLTPRQKIDAALDQADVS